MPDKFDKLKDQTRAVITRMLKKQRAKSGMVGLSFNNHELALAHVEYRGGEPELLLCESAQASSFGEAAKVLGGLVGRHGLEGARCNFVMSAEDYSLLLIEAPAVEEQELASAARWKVKDMVDRPLEELVISVFRVPDDAYRVNREMLYVVAAERKRIQHVVDMIFDAELNLESIDIPELAMMNLLELQDIDDENGIALIDLRHNGSLLSLCKNEALYLTRHLNTQVGEDISASYEWDTVRERLVLEIQRSLDYYESQMGQGHVNRVLMTPRKQDSEALVTELREHMGLQVEVLDLERLSSGPDVSQTLKQSCLMAIGGALRVEAAA